MDFGYYKPKHKIQIKDLEEQYISENYETIPEDDLENNYNPFQIDKLQQYQPIYQLFFDMSETTYNSIQFNHRFHFVNINTVFDRKTDENIQKNIFIKYSPLYDPIRYMVGKYDLKDSKLLSLPSLLSKEDNTPAKFLDTNNASYIDCFFSYLSGQLLHQYGFKHGIEFYGSFLGIQKKFKMNVFDDYEHLNNSTFFRNHCSRLFHLSKVPISQMYYTNHSRRNKAKLIIEAPDVQIECDNLDIQMENDALSQSNSTDESNGELTEIIYINNNEFDNQETTSCPSPQFDNITIPNIQDEESINSSSDSEANYTDDSSFENTSASSDSSNEDTESEEDTYDNEDDDDEDDDDEDDDDEDDEDSNPDEILNIYVDNFPIQMICMEKCHGTLDQLFENNNIDAKSGISALFQIVMILLMYQKQFEFTHNDLHTNNIMYIETEEPFLYYKYKNTMYKVPTYGRIFKIIDFGRSIYKFQGKLFCSDSFGPGGDASTQYNFEPYYNDKKPKIDPNYSFDLCRLGTSIFDFLFDIDNMPAKMDDLQKTIYRWCQDDCGKNVLYKQNGEERYPNFKLYKMIARTVHEHTPENQLKYSCFKRFEISESKINKKQPISIINIPNTI